MLSFEPPPCIRIVSSLVTIAVLQNPSTDTSDFSRVSPRSSVMTVPPVRIAKSLRIALRLSPKAGALTAQTLRPPRSLLRTRAARASLSISSLTMMRGLLSLTTCSRRWRIL